MAATDQERVDDLEYANLSDIRRALKRLAEFDFANPKRLDRLGNELMKILMTAHEVDSEFRLWQSSFTDVQYLLMFPKHRTEIAKKIFAGNGSKECVLDAFITLVQAANIRHRFMLR